MKFLVFILIITLPILTLGQSKNKGTFKVRKPKTEKVTIKKEDVRADRTVEILPVNNNIFKPYFPGGSDEMDRFINKNLVYPKKAIKEGAYGTVHIQFIVKKDGTLKDIKLLNPSHKQLDAEALRIVKLMPKWNPGTESGEAVEVSHRIPIRFSLKNQL